MATRPGVHPARALRVGLYLQSWHVGGVAVFCERLAGGLATHGWQACVILSTPFGKRDAAGREAYERLLANALFPVECLHLHAFHPKERPWRAADRFTRLRFDALLLSAHQPIADGLAPLSRNSALIGVAHNDDEDTGNEFLASEAHCDAYVGVSTNITAKLASLRASEPPIPLHAIRHGVPMPPDQAGRPNTGPGRVLVVARLEQRQKRVLQLPEIWRHYRAGGGEGTLTICGSGPEAERLHRAFGAEIERGEVRLAGAVPLDQMPEVYAQHDILLSISAYEGLPMAVLEATVHGLFPVLSRISSGHSEIIDTLGVGRLCEVGDAKGFAAALRDLTAGIDTLRSRRLGIQALARKHFNFQRMVADYADLIEEVIQQRSARGGPRVPPPAHCARPRVDFVRRFLRRWKYSRHFGWQR